jgi:hypothetical protein
VRTTRSAFAANRLDSGFERAERCTDVVTHDGYLTRSRVNPFDVSLVIH